MLNIIANIIWILGIIFAIGWCFQVRQKAKNEQAREKTFELLGLLLTISVILIPLIKLSPFHLIWIFPISYVISLLSFHSPLRFLWFFSSIYFSFWYIGINNKGRRYYLSGEYNKAINSYKEQISKKPTSSELHFNLGLAYGKIGESENEINSYNEAIRLKSNVPEIYYNLGLVYNETGNSQKAISPLNEAIRLKPGYFRAEYLLCKVYANIGDRENALKKHEIIQEIDKTKGDELYSFIKNKMDLK
ncbi:hypothetical protein CVT91_05165 [Candidatus Atribacteria bacterium HGW-Atribacteria-1]|nr:MAG: hypothetical protein CVT91_05165 [Candidatus Atribacteria bacterium HGW-Atribacteria-1]